ncbi:nucleotide pyrophosphohydrolase [Nocardiopsis sp. TSRI0078]|nr:nucleotide pyrophosphohydrolase [Nocardiopsis sp. TSRI0078]
MQPKARAVAELYAARDTERFGRPWTPEELALGLVGDIGDLAKLVRGKAGVRPHPDLGAAPEHGLADCLWSLIALADAYAIDLEAAFEQTMDELSHRLEQGSAGDRAER